MRVVEVGEDGEAQMGRHAVQALPSSHMPLPSWEEVQLLPIGEQSVRLCRGEQGDRRKH